MTGHANGSSNLTVVIKLGAVHSAFPDLTGANGN